MSLRVTDVVKSYEREQRALNGVSLEVAPGELLAVVGPSGSGKSTLLRCIAGLETPDVGKVEVAGKDVTGAAPGDRDVAMIFQDLALYPHLSVRQNIAFPLLARKASKDEVTSKVDTVSASLGLTQLLDRLPQALSGGERRRVAIARAVIREPQLFLMDEPLSNLDAELKLKVQEDLRALQQRLGVATVYVTHDQAEAIALGEKLAVMRAGEVVQVGTPVQLYDSPETEWVARFFGRFPMNVMHGSAWGEPRTPKIGLRPESIDLITEGGGQVSGRIQALEILGPDLLVVLSIGGGSVRVVTGRSFTGAPGDEVGLIFDPSAIHRFDAGGARL